MEAPYQVEAMPDISSNVQLTRVVIHVYPYCLVTYQALHIKEGRAGTRRKRLRPGAACHRWHRGFSAQAASDQGFSQWPRAPPRNVHGKLSLARPNVAAFCAETASAAAASSAAGSITCGIFRS